MLFDLLRFRVSYIRICRARGFLSLRSYLIHPLGCEMYKFKKNLAWNIHVTYKENFHYSNKVACINLYLYYAGTRVFGYYKWTVHCAVKYGMRRSGISFVRSYGSCATPRDVSVLHNDGR